MLRDSDVQSQLIRLRDSEISLVDFDRWVMSAGWNLHKKVPVGGRVYNLVRDLQGYLSEYEHGEYNAEEVRQALLSLVAPPPVPTVWVTLTANTPITVSMNSDPIPERVPRYVNSMATRNRLWLAPQLAEL